MILLWKPMEGAFTKSTVFWEISKGNGTGKGNHILKQKLNETWEWKMRCCYYEGKLTFFHLILPTASSHIIHCISLFRMDHTVETILPVTNTCAFAVWHSLGKSQSSRPLSCILPAWLRWEPLHLFSLLEVLSSFRSELPFVLKGVCFAVRFLRETSWWGSWPPQHLSHTSCGPQGLSKFILKSCDLAWVKYSPFLPTGADKAAEDGAVSFFKIFLHFSPWSFSFLCPFTPILFSSWFLSGCDLCKLFSSL